MPSVKVRAQGITLERLVAKHARGYVPGLVERVLAANPGLSALPDELPVGTVVAIPTVEAAHRARRIEPIRLVD